MSNKRNLLFIDPYPEELSVYLLPLEARGFLIFKTDSIKEAFQIIKKDRPCLIITELIFPNSGISGFEIINKLKQNKLSNKIPILLFTHADPEIGHGQAIKAGAIGFLTKTSRRVEQTAEYIDKVAEEISED